MPVSTRPTLCPLEPRDTPAFINPALAERFAVGGDGLNATARLVRLQPDNTLAVDFQVVPFPGFVGEVHVAAADVNGDRVRDLITAAGPGGGPHVRVFDGVNGNELASYFAYSPAFLGGVNVAAADVNRDGITDIITGAGPGGGPHVRVFSGATTKELRSFFAYDPRFAGGVSVAGGDLTLDGFAEIATGAGPGGGPHVKVFDGVTLVELQSFMAFDPNSTRGVNVALGDVNQDRRADLVTTVAGPTPPPRSDLVSAGGVTPPSAVVLITQNPFWQSLFTRPLDPFGVGYDDAIRVGTADVDGDRRQDVLFGTGPGNSSVRVVFASDIVAGNLLNNSVLVDRVFDGNGVFVG